MFGNPITYIEKGDAYLSNSDYESALKEYNKAIIAKENYAPSYVKRGDAYRRLENYEMSKADYDKALELDSDCVEALEGLYFYNTSNIKSMKFEDYKKEQDALENTIMELCNRLLEKNPNDLELYIIRARHYSDKDIFKTQIISDYNKAISLAPYNPQLYLSRARVPYFYFLSLFFSFCSLVNFSLTPFYFTLGNFIL